MRRTTTLTMLAALAATTLAPLGAAPAASAAATCDGKVATIVVTEMVNSYTSAPVTGTPGDDVILGTEENDTIDGAGGNDTVCGSAGADTLVGGDGDDRLFGGADADYEPDDGYYGDLLVPGAGNDHVDLGTGSSDIWFWESDLQVDQVSYADAPAGVRVDLAAGTATGHGTDTIVTGTPGRPIGVIGSAYDDTLLGTTGRDVVDAGGGDDEVSTGEGADVIDADHPGRTTSGWRGFESAPEPEPAPVTGDDVVSAGPGSDLVRVQRGADVVRGDADVDRLFSESPEAGTRLLGGGGNDRLYGDSGTRMEGQGGNDRFDIELVAGGNDHWWSGGAGRDSLNLYFHRSLDLDELRFDVPRRRVDADGARLATYRSIENVLVGDRLERAVFRGGSADERFYANARRVHATGGAGDDRLEGSRGRDLLDGGPGRDRLSAGAGTDRCLRGERLSSCERRR